MENARLLYKDTKANNGYLLYFVMGQPILLVADIGKKNSTCVITYGKTLKAYFNRLSDAVKDITVKGFEDFTERNSPGPLSEIFKVIFSILPIFT